MADERDESGEVPELWETGDSGFAAELLNCESILDGLGLCPIMILMTLDAAAFGGFFGIVGAMALLAGTNSRQENVGCFAAVRGTGVACLLYTSPSPRDGLLSRM